jgi:hypothetical protein
MANHVGAHADRGLVNGKVGTQSTLTIRLKDGFKIKGYDVKGGQVTDDSPKTNGVWKAVRLKKDDAGAGDTELRLLLTCTTQPEKNTKAPSDSGNLTITLTKSGSGDETVTQPVDYANDPPP